MEVFLCSLELLWGAQVLKETLLRHGFVFESDTDTEVIPKLAKIVYDSLLEESKTNGGDGTFIRDDTGPDISDVAFHVNFVCQNLRCVVQHIAATSLIPFQVFHV